MERDASRCVVVEDNILSADPGFVRAPGSPARDGFCPPGRNLPALKAGFPKLPLEQIGLQEGRMAQTSPVRPSSPLTGGPLSPGEGLAERLSGNQGHGSRRDGEPRQKRQGLHRCMQQLRARKPLSGDLEISSRRRLG